MRTISFGCPFSAQPSSAARFQGSTAAALNHDEVNVQKMLIRLEAALSGNRLEAFQRNGSRIEFVGDGIAYRMEPQPVPGGRSPEIILRNVDSGSGFQYTPAAGKNSPASVRYLASPEGEPSAPITGHTADRVRWIVENLQCRPR